MRILFIAFALWAGVAFAQSVPTIDPPSPEPIPVICPFGAYLLPCSTNTPPQPICIVVPIEEFIGSQLTALPKYLFFIPPDYLVLCF